jgi:hypothetical protein
MNDRSSHTVIESSVRERYTCERNLAESFERLERNLEGSFEKLYNFNKVSCQEVAKTFEDVNFKLGTKIKSGNNEIISDFNHVMIKTINNISKQVVVEVKNHLDVKEVKITKS